MAMPRSIAGRGIALGFLGCLCSLLLMGLASASASAGAGVGAGGLASGQGEEGGELSLKGIYRLQLDPAAPTLGEALQPGEPASELHPGELILLSGQGFTPDCVVMFGELAAEPLFPPLSGDSQLVVMVPPKLPPGEVAVYVLREGEGKGEGERSEVKQLYVAACEGQLESELDHGQLGRETHWAFLAMDKFLFFAEQAIWLQLEELPPAIQGFAIETSNLIARERLLALQLKEALMGLAPEELAMLDALFISVNFTLVLREAARLLEQAAPGLETEVLEELAHAARYKGSALRALGEFLDELTLSGWDGSKPTSIATRKLGRLFRALGELDNGLAENAAFLGGLLRWQAQEARLLKLDRSVGALAAQLAELERQLGGFQGDLGALREQLDRWGSELGFSLSSGFQEVGGRLETILERLDERVLPGIAGVLGRLDSPDYGLAEIKSELALIESQLALTVIPSLEELLRRQRATTWEERLEKALAPVLSSLQELTESTSYRLGQLRAELMSPQHGLAGIKSELSALEVKVDRIWRCLTTLTLEYEEVPAIVERAPVDVILAIDSSGSMKTNDPQRLRIATAEGFIAQLDPQRDQAGVVSWDNDIDFVQPLTSDLERVRLSLGKVDASGATNLNVGLAAAINEFVRGRPEAKKVIILLTDGDGSYTFSSQPGSPVALARRKGITIYAIGLGSAPARRKLEDMASATGGQVYLAPTAEDLQEIYARITEQLIVPKKRVMRITCSVGGLD